MKKLLMSAVALTAFSLSILLFQISCIKESKATTPINPTIQGLWIGTYTTDSHSEYGEQYFSFIIKPDGTMIADTKGADTQHLSPGTWALKGDTLACTFTCVYGLPANVGVTETSTAIWDESGKLSGKWKNSPSPTGSGTIKLTKIN